VLLASEPVVEVRVAYGSHLLERTCKKE